MTTFPLQAFLEPVPTCRKTDGLGRILDVFRQGEWDSLVVLGSSGEPLGLLTLRSVLPYLLRDQGGAEIPRLSPLNLVPVDWSLERFWDWMENQPLQKDAWGFVDRQGNFLGLLNVPQFMQQGPVKKLALAHHMLEKLPVPLMIQTSNGRVVLQNSLWRQQVGELRDPGWLQQEAAHLLGHTTDIPEEGSYCRAGSEPQTCICVCPLKNGQERVWQFSRIALDFMHGPGMPGNPVRQLSKFQLGALEPTAPDPLLGADPEGALWLVIALDRTEEHQAAQELVARNADLVQLNSLKDEFLSCISHELKTPLTAVLGLSSLLQEKLLGDLNLRQMRYVQLIYQSGRQLSGIVNDILDLTRVETAQLELELETIDVRVLCERVVVQAQSLRVEKFETPLSPEEVSEDRPILLEIGPGIEEIVADETRLSQMLTNLISNALKFTDKAGTVGLKVNRWQDWIAFTIWDTGIGIPVDKQHLVFQKFQQLEHPLTRRYEGTGLGLVLTQRLARLHGGDVTFISREGQGSEFTLLLPPQPEGDAPKNAQHEPNRLALVVEAAACFTEDLHRHLIDQGYHVVVARSGTEALEKARRLRPCIIFINPLLPILSGWDVLTLLKSNPTTQQIPVVVVASRGEKSRALKRADSFLNLPVVPESLREVLERLPGANPKPPSRQLTLLRLIVPGWHPEEAAGDTPLAGELRNLMHTQDWRILEADDLDQAELLTRVWQPQVVLLEEMGQKLSGDYLEQLSQQPLLSNLPLVTTNESGKTIGQEVPQLKLFTYCHDQGSLAPDASLLGVIRQALAASLK